LSFTPLVFAFITDAAFGYVIDMVVCCLESICFATNLKQRFWYFSNAATICTLFATLSFRRCRWSCKLFKQSFISFPCQIC